MARKEERELKKELSLASMQQRAEENVANRQLRRDMMASKSGDQALASELKASRLAQMNREAKEAADKLAFDKTLEGRKAKLSAETKGRFDNARMALGAVQAMDDSLAAGDNTFSLVGDNDYTMSRAQFEEALGRMQSGGAITKDEEIKFKKMAPGATDSQEIQRKKLARLQSEMAQRLETLGFKPEEIGLAVRDIKYGTGSGVEPTQGMGASATASPQRPDFSQMSEADLKKYLEGK